MKNLTFLFALLGLLSFAVACNTDSGRQEEVEESQFMEETREDMEEMREDTEDAGEELGIQ